MKNEIVRNLIEEGKFNIVLSAFYFIDMNNSHVSEFLKNFNERISEIIIDLLQNKSQMINVILKIITVQ